MVLRNRRAVGRLDHILGRAVEERGEDISNEQLKAREDAEDSSERLDFLNDFLGVLAFPGGQSGQVGRLVRFGLRFVRRRRVSRTLARFRYEP